MGRRLRYAGSATWCGQCVALLSTSLRYKTDASAMVAARARRYLPRTGEGHAFTERRAALVLYSRVRTKTEQKLMLLVKERCMPIACGTLHVV